MENADYIDMDAISKNTNNSPQQTKSRHRKTANKDPHPTPTILKWLNTHYELAEGVCIPRSTLYVHYSEFCRKTNSTPVNSASFGKMIRQQFPQLTTRRLGTRGQSKYHYYGIAVKETSEYFEESYSSKVADRTLNDVTKKEHSRQTIAYSPRSKLGTLLPAFPEIVDIKLPTNVPSEKVSTFLVMYRTHCQRILDTIIRANFDEVQSYLLHFWQGMPTHMLEILDSATVADIVGLCDSILYKAITGVLMPSVIQTVPESLTQVIESFAGKMEGWLRTALEHLPESLRDAKFTTARHFSRLLRRQTSLNHLCHASRNVIQNADVTAQMADDWSALDIGTIATQTLYDVRDMGPVPNLYELCDEFEELLNDQSSLEAYTNWLDTQVQRCVQEEPPGQRSSNVCQRSRKFMFVWSNFSAKIMRDMTLDSAPSFGSFHLLHVTLEEYVQYRLELVRTQYQADRLLQRLKRSGEIEEAPDTDEILSSGNDRTFSTRRSFQSTCQQQFCEGSFADTTETSAQCVCRDLPGPSSGSVESYTAQLGPEPNSPYGPLAQPHDLRRTSTDFSTAFVHTSQNSAFSPIMSSNSANHGYYSQTDALDIHPEPEPNYTRPATSSCSYISNNFHGNESRAESFTNCFDSDSTLLPLQGRYDNRFAPVGTGYSSLNPVPTGQNDTVCASQTGELFQDYYMGTGSMAD